MMYKFIESITQQKSASTELVFEDQVWKVYLNHESMYGLKSNELIWPMLKTD